MFHKEARQWWICGAQNVNEATAEEVAEAVRLSGDSSEIKQEYCALANCLPLGKTWLCLQSEMDTFLSLLAHF